MFCDEKLTTLICNICFRRISKGKMVESMFLPVTPSTEHVSLEMSLANRVEDNIINTNLTRNNNGKLENIWYGLNHSFQHDFEENTCGIVGKRKVTIAEIIACFISILTVLENVLILIAITKGPRSLRKPPYWFIASLAAADLLTGLEVVLAIFTPVGNSPLSRIFLKGMAVVTFIVSINSLLLVSLDRYLRIAHHTDYYRMLTRKTIILLISISWLVSFGMFLAAPLLGWSCAENHCCATDGLCICKRSVYGNRVCYTYCSQSFVPFSKSYILSGVVYFVIAIVAMVGFYAALFRVVKKKTFGHNRTGSGSSNKPSKTKKRDVQLAKTLIITLGVFVVCWLPAMALFVVDVITTNPTKELSKVFDYALVPSVINSFLNPIIYSIRLPCMRNTIKNIAFPCIFRGNSRTHLGATWATETSLENSTRRRSVRKRIEKLKDRSGGSSTGSVKSPTNMTRSRMVSSKSANSEASFSIPSTLSQPSIPGPKS